MEKPEHRTTVLAVVCVDWHIHHPQSNFLHALYKHINAGKIHLVTFPAPDSLPSLNNWAIECLERDIVAINDMLAEHGHFYVHKYIVAHEHCMGHDVTCEQHRLDVAKTAHLLNKRNTHSPRFLPLFAKRGEDDYLWTMESVPVLTA